MTTTRLRWRSHTWIGTFFFALLAIGSAGVGLAVAPVEAIPDVVAPCWLRRAGIPTGYGNNGQHELILGNLRGQLKVVAGEPVAYADAFFGSDDCQLGDLVATDPTSFPFKLPANAPFQVRLESAMAIDDAGTGDVTFSVSIERRSSCTSTTIIWSDAKSAVVTFGATPAYDFVELDPWGSGGLWFNLVGPPAGSYQFWTYTIEAATSLTGGTSKASKDSGCFRVEAVP